MAASPSFFPHQDHKGPDHLLVRRERVPQHLAHRHAAALVGGRKGAEPLPSSRMRQGTPRGGWAPRVTCARALPPGLASRVVRRSMARSAVVSVTALKLLGRAASPREGRPRRRPRSPPPPFLWRGPAAGRGPRRREADRERRLPLAPRPRPRSCLRSARGCASPAPAPARQSSETSRELRANPALSSSMNFEPPMPGSAQSPII